MACPALRCHTQRSQQRLRHRPLLLRLMGLPWETHPKGEERRAAEEQLKSSRREPEPRREYRGHSIRCAQALGVFAAERKCLFGALKRTAETSDDLH